MDDATYEQESGRIERYVRKWASVLFPGGMKLNVVTLRDGDDHARQGHGDAAGLATASWEYQWAEISFDLSKLTHMDDYEVELVVLHELMHVMLQGLMSVFADDDDNISRAEALIIERTATDMAAAFSRAQHVCDSMKPCPEQSETTPSELCRPANVIPFSGGSTASVSLSAS